MYPWASLNKALIKPVFPGGGGTLGGRLTSHDEKALTTFQGHQPETVFFTNLKPVAEAPPFDPQRSMPSVDFVKAEASGRRITAPGFSQQLPMYKNLKRSGLIFDVHDSYYLANENKKTC